MHELGYASQIEETLVDLMKEQSLTVISEVTVDIGEATGVVPRFLLECWPAAIEGTPIEGCVLKVNGIKATGECRRCEKTFPITLTHGVCPHCGSSDEYNILTGYEFEISEIRGH